jgi:hypothetical protein
VEIILKDKETILDTLSVTDIGMLGELKVWVKLKELGYTGQLFTFSESRHSGCDIILTGGTTLEVKSSNRRTEWNMYKSKEAEFRVNKVYAFNVKATTADFVIVYIKYIPVRLDEKEEEIFYICPTRMLNKGVNKIYPDARKWLFLKNNWELIEAKGSVDGIF